MRKYTLTSYLELLTMMDGLYRNRNAVRACLGLIRTLAKVEKINSDGSEAKRFAEELEAYKGSAEYKKMVEELRKRDEDDEFRNDYDPQGYDLYEKAVSITIVKVIFMFK
jgi:hypothetical protein